jgi:hypothetical protein
MRSRLFGVAVSAVLLAVNAPLAAQQAQTGPTGDSAPKTQSGHDAQAAKLTFNGEAALLTVAIRPDKTADFEHILSKLQAALKNSSDPERQKQAVGWKIIRLATPLPDGNIAYIHVVDPVVAGAGYGVMQILYDAFPDERQHLYELYRDAFVRNVALAVGSVAIDMHGAQSPPQP